MRILCVGTNQEEFQLLELVLSKEFSELEFADNISIWDPFTFGQQLEGGFDVVLLQEEFEWRDRALSFLRKQWPEVPIVILAEAGQQARAVEAIKAGASDYLIRSSKTYLELPEMLRKLQAQRPDPVAQAPSQERIFALIDRAEIGWFQARLDGELIDANEALLRLLGAERPEQLRGCGIPVMGPRPLGAFNERGELSRQVIELAKSGGETVPVLVTELILLDADGAMVIDGLVEDARSWQERGSEQDRDAGSGTGTGTDSDGGRRFATMLAHELRRPLRAARHEIDKAAESLFTNAEPGSLPDALQPLSERLDRIDEVVESLSQLARVGSSEPVSELCDARDSVRTAMSNLSGAIDEAGAVFTVRALPTVRAAPAQLTMLFQNLIGNALAFSGNESPDVRISARQEDTDWVFTVRDNGVGFDPEVGEALFEPFRKLDPDSAGSGIGLAICKWIVEAHGGRIWAESEPGQGAAFHFTLPLLEAARERA